MSCWFLFEIVRLNQTHHWCSKHRLRFYHVFQQTSRFFKTKSQKFIFFKTKSTTLSTLWYQYCALLYHVTCTVQVFGEEVKRPHQWSRNEVKRPDQTLKKKGKDRTDGQKTKKNITPTDKKQGKTPHQRSQTGMRPPPRPQNSNETSISGVTIMWLCSCTGFSDINSVKIMFDSSHLFTNFRSK